MQGGISVIIPVYEEAANIGSAVAHLLAQAPCGPVEIVVVDGDPLGGTLEAVRSPEVVRLKAARGRARQMNAGAAAAGGDILLFLHADTRLPPGGLARARQCLEGAGNTVAGAFDLGIDSPRAAYRAIEAVVRVRTRLTRVPYGDQAIFVDRRFFRRLGGFREIPIMEDVDLMRRVRKAGGAVGIVPEKTVTSPRRWEKEGIVRCTLRNWAIVCAYLAGARPERLAKFYR